MESLEVTDYIHPGLRRKTPLKPGEPKRKPLERTGILLPRSKPRRISAARQRLDRKLAPIIDAWWSEPTQRYCAVTLRPITPNVDGHRHHAAQRKGAEKFEKPRFWAALWSVVHDHLHSGGGFFEDGERMPKLTPGHVIWSMRELNPSLDVDEFYRLRGWSGAAVGWEVCQPADEFMRVREVNQNLYRWS